MKFGLFYLPSFYPNVKREPQFYREMIEQVEYADRNGFDAVYPQRVIKAGARSASFSRHS